MKIVTPLAQGLGMTLKHFFRKPITLQYPDQKMTMYPRFRGRVYLVTDPETGLEKCIACNRCAMVCPAQAIKIEGGKREDGSRYPVKFEVNLGRCIFCGFCAETCPKDAIKSSHAYELAVGDKSKLHLSKEDLLQVPAEEKA